MEAFAFMVDFELLGFFEGLRALVTGFGSSRVLGFGGGVMVAAEVLIPIV